jgi:hypothetical protein
MTSLYKGEVCDGDILFGIVGWQFGGEVLANQSEDI